MAIKTFFSFHYQPDSVRASQVRNIGSIEDNKSVSDNDWESIKKGGDKAIQNWIDDQLSGRKCTVVLIGADTAGRKWINYEIVQSWNKSMGVVGIYIHNLKNFQGEQSRKGSNPFDGFTMDKDKAKLSSIVKAYDPPYKNSKEVYDYIFSNIEKWIKEAIKIRDDH